MYVATVELENIRTRQAEGIAAAKARGVKFGRPPKKRPPEFANIRAAWAFGHISAREAARLWALRTEHSSIGRVKTSIMENFGY